MFARRPSQSKSKTESFSKKNESFSRKGSRVVKNSFRDHAVSKNRYEERPRTRKPPVEEPIHDKYVFSSPISLHRNSFDVAQC